MFIRTHRSTHRRSSHLSTVAAPSLLSAATLYSRPIVTVKATAARTSEPHTVRLYRRFDGARAFKLADAQQRSIQSAHRIQLLSFLRVRPYSIPLWSKPTRSNMQLTVWEHEPSAAHCTALHCTALHRTALHSVHSVE